MIWAIMVTFAIALGIFLASSSFFVQLVALNLSSTVLILIVATARGSQQSVAHFETGAWIVASINSVLIFTVAAAGVRRLSLRNKDGG